jgi:hypothetical protein
MENLLQYFTVPYDSNRKSSEFYQGEVISATIDNRTLSIYTSGEISLWVDAQLLLNEEATKKLYELGVTDNDVKDLPFGMNSWFEYRIFENGLEIPNDTIFSDLDECVNLLSEFLNS